jgi:hypothetical protein
LILLLNRPENSKRFDDINQHILAGAKKVILSAPSEVDEIKTVVLGVNEHILDGSETYNFQCKLHDKQRCSDD